MTGIFFERPHQPALSEHDIRRVLGPVDNEIVVAIQDTGATRDEVLRAYAWFDEEDGDDILLNRPLTYRSRRVYDILRDDLGRMDSYTG